MMLLLASLWAAAAGCETRTRVVRDGWADLRAMADPKPETAGEGEDGRPASWVIELERFVGADRMAKAEAVAMRIREQAHLPNVQIQDTGVAAVVGVGPVSDPRSDEAEAILRRVREASIDGMQAYRGAAWRPMGGGAVREVYDPRDLRQFAGMYTLQVGFYDAQFGPDFRAAAEQAVDVLRDDGHDAYFYHGPHRSLVTVGVFSYEEAFVRVENPLAPGTLIDSYSPPVRELQKTFPYNLGNGLTLIEKVRGERVGEQPSSLVRVPQR